MISIKNNEEKNDDRIRKLNLEINEFKRLQLSKDNEIRRINEVLSTKKNEIISLKKIIEEQKNGSREKEIEEIYKKEKEKLVNKINDMELKIYNITEEKNNMIKMQSILKNENEEFVKKLQLKENEININERNTFNIDDIRIIQSDIFTIEKSLQNKSLYNNKNKEKEIEMQIMREKEEKEQLIVNNNKLRKEIKDIKDKYEELIKENNINKNKIINEKYKEFEKIIDDYKTGKIISEKTKKIVENLKKNNSLEKEQFKKKYKNEIELLNLKNNSISVINNENEKKINELNEKNKIILSEKNELENVILIQEKKVNELEIKINKIDLILKKKNEKIKENEKCTLQLINIVNEQQNEIKKLKRVNSNDKKSLNEILSLKTQIQELNNTFKQNNIVNSKDNKINASKNIKKAFSTKKDKSMETLLNNNYLENEKKGIQKKKRFLKIKINDSEGKFFSTSNLVNFPKKNYRPYIPSKIGDDLVYLNVNMNWINTKNTKLKTNNENNDIEKKINKIKNKINLTTPKLPNITYSNKNNSRMSKLNKLQNEENEKKEEINQMMEKIIEQI